METTLVCEGLFEIEAISNMLIPLNSKTILTLKPQRIIEKIGMYYANCHRTNNKIPVKSKERKIMFLQFLKLPLNKSKYKYL